MATPTAWMVQPNNQDGKRGMNNIVTLTYLPGAGLRLGTGETPAKGERVLPRSLTSNNCWEATVVTYQRMYRGERAQ